MDIKKMDQQSLQNLKAFDHYKLLDCIEKLTFIRELLALGSKTDPSDLHKQLLKLHQDVIQLKTSNKSTGNTEIWQQAIEVEQVIWEIGESCHLIIHNLYELLDCNPNLEYKNIDEDDISGGEE